MPGLNPPFANNPLVRRPPNVGEIANGLPCGPADRELFNFLWHRSEAMMLSVLQGAGVTPQDDNFDQLLEAVIKIHRITQSVIYTVPGSFPTLQACLLSLVNKIIPTNVEVVIQLGPGDHIVNVESGPIVLAHPFGNRIRLVGQPLVSNFPSFAEVNNNSAVVVETVLRAKFPTRIIVQGAVRAGVYMKAGAWGSIENILFIGDSTIGQHGLLIGEWEGEMGYGMSTLRKLWFHRCGNAGMRLNYYSAIQGYQIGATHNGNCGLLMANMSAAHFLGGCIAAYNTLAGLQMTDNSFAEVIQGEGDFRNNGGSGINVANCSSFQSGEATALRAQNNAGAGILVSGGSYGHVKAFTGGSNVSPDVMALNGSHIQTQAMGSASYSPSPGSVGNNNSFIS